MKITTYSNTEVIVNKEELSKLLEQAEKMAEALVLYEQTSIGEGYGDLKFPAKYALEKWKEFKK